MRNFIKDITPDFILDFGAFLGKVKTFFSRLMSFQNPFKEPPDYEKEDLIVAETSAVQGLGGFKFDLSIDPMETVEDEDGDEVFTMGHWDVAKIVEGVCVDGDTLAANTKRLVDTHNLPVAVAKKYAERFERSF